MLKKSMVNRVQPHVADAKGGSKGMPSQPAQATSRKGNSSAGVILTEAKGAKHKATFRAPRQGGGESPMECGYTKPGKM